LIGETYLGWGKLGLRAWKVAIGVGTGRGGLGLQNRNLAIEAWLLQMERKGCYRSIGETYLEWGKPALKGWEAEIDQ